MAKQRRGAFTEEVVEVLLQEQKKVKNIKEWRQMEAIWLREKLHMSGPQVAEILQYRRQTVHLLWHQWLDRGIAIFTEKKPPGGRNNAYMTLEEEQAFLRPFAKTAPSGGIVETGRIKEAFEAHVGERVPTSTIYRLLRRHGWRKVTPRKRHPKSDPAKQEGIKKTDS
jgi:transposase